MATKNPVEDVDNMVSVQLTYVALVLPVEDACTMMRVFKRAQVLNNEYKDGKSTRYIGGEMPTISFQLMSGSDYVEGVINGANKQSE